jgi:hypothetical protein
LRYAHRLFLLASIDRINFIKKRLGIYSFNSVITLYIIYALVNDNSYAAHGGGPVFAAITLGIIYLFVLGVVWLFKSANKQTMDFVYGDALFVLYLVLTCLFGLAFLVRTFSP